MEYVDKPHITKTPGVCGGRACVAGHRIRVMDIVVWHELRGMSVAKIVKGRTRGHPIRLTTNEWYKAGQLRDSYWLYVVWDTLQNPDKQPIIIRNPAKQLDYAKREVIAARHYAIPAQAIEAAAETRRE